MKIFKKSKLIFDSNNFNDFFNYINDKENIKIKLFKELEKWFNENINSEFYSSKISFNKIQKDLFGKAPKSQWQIIFWTQRGYSEEEAKEKISQLQSANNKKLLEKYTSEELSEILSCKKNMTDEEYKKYTEQRIEKSKQARIEKFINQGFTKEEAIEQCKIENTKHLEKARKVERLIPTQLDYWIKKGYSKEDAILKVGERQSTFSKNKCIAQFGKDEGLERFKERQLKWQESYKKTMNEKYGVDSFVCADEFKKHLKITKPHQEIIDFIKSIYSGEILVNDRKTIYPFELDIFIPEFNFAIELDGIYWHSGTNTKNRNIHLEKTIQCENKNIHLFRILDLEWNNNLKQEIWKSKIKYKLKKASKIYARKCSIKEMDAKTSKSFFEKNHLQGNVNASVKLGLFYNDNLVSVMTFGKSRFKNNEYELLRFATILNYTVNGGFSKLLKHFIKNFNPENLISYGNRRWVFKNNIYQNFFKKVEITKPNYFYWKGKKLYHRINFQKHKLKNKLEYFDANLTEIENMVLNGFKIYFDCGNYKYYL